MVKARQDYIAKRIFFLNFSGLYFQYVIAKSPKPTRGAAADDLGWIELYTFEIDMSWQWLEQSAHIYVLLFHLFNYVSNEPLLDA